MSENDEKYSIKKFILNEIPKFVKDIPGKYLVLFFLVSILLIFQLFCEYQIPLLQRNLVDNSIEKKIISKFDLKILIIYILVYIISLILFNMGYSNFSALIQEYFHKKYYKIISDFRKETINKFGISYLYDVISRDTEIAANFFNPIIFGFLFSIVQIILIMKIIFNWSKQIFYLSICFYIFLIIISIFSSLANSKYLGECRNKAPRHANKISLVFDNILTIKAYLQQERFDKSIYDSARDIYKSAKKLLMIPGLLNVITIFIKYIFTILVTILSLSLIIDEKITFGILVALIAYSQIIFSPIDKFYQLLSSVMNSDISIHRVNWLREISRQYNTDYKNKSIPSEKSLKIEFNNVGFSYKDKNNGSCESTNKNYKDITFNAKYGEKIGIVGLSGEGKSTLLKLFYQEILPDNGSILVNDTNVNNIPFKFYNYFLNVYPQEPEIFKEDLIFNITLGREQISINEKSEKLSIIKNKLNKYFTKILEVCSSDKSNNEKFKNINSLLKKAKDFEYLLNAFELLVEPENYKKIKTDEYLAYLNNCIRNDSFCDILATIQFNKDYCIKERVDEIIENFELDNLKGRDLGENGSNISGGEKQKVAFARFLLKDDYGFFILDEPFTSLDAIIEKKLLSIAKEELKDKTGFIISHKFNILCELADTFIVLENGTVSQRGTHKDLLQEEGLYKSIFEHFIAQRNINSSSQSSIGEYGKKYD